MPKAVPLSYMKSRRMTSGFALVAWPAIYGSSGIMTFQVDQDGVVFRETGYDDLTNSAENGRFDPDMTWARVEVTNQ